MAVCVFSRVKPVVLGLASLERVMAVRVFVAVRVFLWLSAFLFFVFFRYLVWLLWRELRLSVFLLRVFVAFLSGYFFLLHGEIATSGLNLVMHWRWGRFFWRIL